DIFGEPQKTARIGDEYQAQIPSLMTKTDDQDHFDFGLSIPVTWVRSQHKKKKKKERIAIEAKGKSGKIGSKRKNRLLALPCSSVEESWSVIEQDSFILGLYIFGKNLRVMNVDTSLAGIVKVRALASLQNSRRADMQALSSAAAETK
ncbi:hypothetical protein Tco_0713471, partial [Tanacetum coccineum]